jgi:hypothetical protein
MRGAAAALALFCAAPALAQEYLSGHEDLPLLAGLHQDPDSVTVFDAPQGRIVETFAQTREPAKAVLAAYAETLPQMGWTRQSPARYVRGAETLVFEVVDAGPPTVVRILLTSD